MSTGNYRFETLPRWDEGGSILNYWLSHPRATFCHHPGWPGVFARAYGRNCDLYGITDQATGARAGLASLVQFQGPITGKHAVALPYLDYGGPLADNPEAERFLINGLMQVSEKKGSSLEFRCDNALSFLLAPENSKVGMALSLQGWTAETYWKALDAKVRNQVRKAEKSGVTLRVGREDLLDDFYRVFCVNMRDLGSPVHSRKFFLELLRQIPEAEISAAFRAGRCIGGLIRIRWRSTLAIPWASTLREERIHCPNNALYHDSIRQAFEWGLTQVDFGRSTRDEGTYKFKKQWLAEERPLPWYQFDARGLPRQKIGHASSSKLEWATKAWSKMPVAIASLIGAKLRPYIPA